MTHSYSLLEVSPATHTEIERLLRAAGYDHAIDHDQLDMHGLALIAAQQVKEAGSLLGLGQRNFIESAGNVDKSVSVVAAGAQEEHADLVNFGLNGLEHDSKATASASPHSSAPVASGDVTPAATMQATGAVVDMVLYCPKCGMQHIDGVEELPMAVPGSAAEGSAGWVNPPHRSHLCRLEDGGCGHIWRPADVPTNGVQAVKTTGKADSPISTPAPAVQAEAGIHVLAEVVRLLRKQGHYEDEEGEATNHLDDLLAALAQAAPAGRL